MPARTIVEFAHEQQADLLVMNTRGRSCAAAILLGSVTAQVMLESHVALLAVKHYGAALGLFQVIRERHLGLGPNPKMN